MFENKYSKMITIILVLMIILILAVLIYLGYRVVRTFNLQNDARQEAERFENELQQNYTDTNTQSNTQVGDVSPDITPDISPENEVFVGGGSTTPKEETYKGFVKVGTIDIPRTNLKCPVLEKASSEAIEVAVGIYYGPGLNQIGNTVIAGHNYRDGTFFSNNKKIEEGDKIYITDLTGNKVTYTVYKIQITSPQDSEYINRDTQGKREISLTTCTDDTRSRLIIFASAD